MRKYFKWIFHNKKYLVLGTIFALFVFLRFFELVERLPFGYDQVDNAWAVKSIIVDHKFPLLGMVAKGNSGFNIGPAYYYLIAPIYWIYGMSPISAGVIAGLTAVFTFFILFFLIKKLFSFEVALIAVFINTVSAFIANGDRVQWPVDFIVPLSLIIFYSLFKILLGKVNYFYILAFALGFSLHIHFTSVFYFVIIILCLPFFPRSKKSLTAALISIPIFLIWLAPIIFASMESHNSQASNLQRYLQENYHGLHLTRVRQLTHDAFIEFLAILRFNIVDYFSFLFPVLFAFIYYLTKKSKERLLFCYLTALWFLVPWIAFSTYKGELTNYYFHMTRPLVLIILSYLTYRLFQQRQIAFKFVIILFWFYFAWININDILFNSARPNEFIKSKERVIPRLSNPDNKYNFYTADSYVHFYYADYRKGIID